YAQHRDSAGNLHIYNREGKETYASERDNNIRETRESEARARQEAERESKKQKEEEARKSREAAARRQSSPASSGSGLAGLFLGTAGLTFPFIFNGVLVLVLALLGKIFAPVMPLFKLRAELAWLFLTCWLNVFKIWFTGATYGEFIRDFRIRWVFPVDMAIAGLFLISTLIKTFSRNDSWYQDNRNLKPLIIFPILHLLHSFITIGGYNSQGTLMEIANGLFLGMWVLIVEGWIIRLVNKIKYR
ncbi:MAG: hypothetical protein IIZ74_10655, partial [Erysipelotrichaceae bacterium]|nr:hypothetical protein [Erysipelotrichaceae bacterium]